MILGIWVHNLLGLLAFQIKLLFLALTTCLLTYWSSRGEQCELGLPNTCFLLFLFFFKRVRGRIIAWIPSWVSSYLVIAVFLHGLLFTLKYWVDPKVHLGLKELFGQAKNIHMVFSLPVYLSTICIFPVEMSELGLRSASLVSVGPRSCLRRVGRGIVLWALKTGDSFHIHLDFDSVETLV